MISVIIIQLLAPWQLAPSSLSLKKLSFSSAYVKDVCNNRSTPQIRRCLEKWMVKTDRETLERYKTKALGWKKEVKLGKSDPITAYGPEETIAYSHYFFPSRLVFLKYFSWDKFIYLIFLSYLELSFNRTLCISFITMTRFFSCFLPHTPPYCLRTYCCRSDILWYFSILVQIIYCYIYLFICFYQLIY